MAAAFCETLVIDVDEMKYAVVLAVSQSFYFDQRADVLTDAKKSLNVELPEVVDKTWLWCTQARDCYYCYIFGWKS